MTDKSILPILKIRSGDFGSHSPGIMKFRIGPLECRGSLKTLKEGARLLLSRCHFEIKPRLVWLCATIERLWTPIRQTFAYGIGHIFIVIHWTMSHSSLNNNENMPYPVWKCLLYGSLQPPYCRESRFYSRVDKQTNEPGKWKYDIVAAFCCFWLFNISWQRNKLVPLWHYWAFWNMGLKITS